MTPSRLRISLLVLLCTIAAFGTAATPREASAHAFLQRTQPAHGAVVAQNIGEVRLTFNERVEVRRDRIVVTSAEGRRIDLRDAKAAPGDPASVVVSLPQLPTGVYTVRYAVISTDTHPITGLFRFGVGVSPADVLAGAAAVEEARLTGPLGVQAVGRWLNLLGLILLAGPAAFRLFVLAPVWPRRLRAASDDATRLFEARALRWAWVGVGVLIVAQLVTLVSASLASTFGSVADALRPQALLEGLTGRFGTLWLARLALLLVPALALPVLAAEQELGEAEGEEKPEGRGGAGWWAILAAGGGLAALTAFGGHAATTAPVPLSLTVDWVHLAATIVWIGGLLALALIFPPVVRSLGAAEGLATLATTVPRFSALALVAVQALALTGFYQTWAHVDGPATLGATLYGRALIVKLLLIVPLIALAAINRFVVAPRLRAAAGAADGDATPPRDATRQLWRTLWGEAILGVAILAVVGILTALPPARAEVAASAGTAGGEAPAAASTGLTLAGNAGPTLVNLTIGPTGNGPAILSVTLRDPNGVPIEDATVALRLSPPGGAAAQEVPLTARGGRYVGLGDLDRPGPWRIEATVTARGGAPERTLFALDLPSGGARTILAGADAAMNRLTSLRERQTIGAGGPTTTTVYEWSSPDRLRLRAEPGGSETIVVGTRRFDRAAGGGWIASEWAEPGGYRWPKYEYARTATEVTILGREEVDGVMCWIVTFLDTASEARFTFWIGEDDSLVRRQRMFAVGHYMDSRFYDFNVPIAIEAP